MVGSKALGWCGAMAGAGGAGNAIGGRAGIDRLGNGGKTAVFAGGGSRTISGWASGATGTLDCRRALCTGSGGIVIGGRVIGRTSAMTDGGVSCVRAGRAISGRRGCGMVRITCWHASENATMKNGASKISRDWRSSRE